MMFRRSATLVLMLACAAWSMGPSAEAETFTELKQRIIRDKILSIESLLPQLSDSLRSKYVLMFHSRSRQEASFTDPRVLLYGDNGKFILAFNGNPQQRGFYNLEVAEFDDATRQFSLYEIQFPKPSSKDQQVRFSAANANACTACHGTPARPIWDSHPLWPGAYGQAYHAPLTPDEAAGLSLFLANQAKHSRYQFLKNLALYRQPATFAPTTLSRYEGSDKYPPPNAALGQMLNDINLKIIAHDVTSAPDFAQLQYVLLASLNQDCQNLETYVPSEIRAATAQGLRQWAQETQQQNGQAQLLKRVRAKVPTPVAGRIAETTDLNDFRFFVETGLGLSTDRWTMALEKRTYDFTAIGDPNKTLTRLILPSAVKNDPSLAHLQALLPSGNGDLYCAELRRKSRAASLHLRTPSDQPRLAHLQPFQVLQKCTACHQGEIAPSLPLSDPLELAKALDQGSYPRGTLRRELGYRLNLEAGDDFMPRSHMTTPEQRQELTHFLNNLSSSQRVGAP